MSRDRRSTAEWTTLAASCVVLLVVVVVIIAQMFGSTAPPDPVADIRPPYRIEAGGFHVTVEVSNRGDQTAANVQVSAELELAGEIMSAEQSIDFLAGDATQELVFVFEDDPADGTLTVVVSSYSLP